MKKMTCPPPALPKAGEIYKCASDCGFEVEITSDCECEDKDCVSLSCCGAAMTKAAA
jgi:hypothetical protein